MAEHSMCQPGRPSPYFDGQRASGGKRKQQTTRSGLKPGRVGLGGFPSCLGLSQFSAACESPRAMQPLPLLLPFRVFVWHFLTPRTALRLFKKTWAQLGRKTRVFG